MIYVERLPGPMVPTDAYGFKRWFGQLNEIVRCPNDGFFLVYKDEKQDTFLCEKCGFEKPAIPLPTLNDIEPIETWRARQLKLQKELKKK